MPTIRFTYGTRLILSSRVARHTLEPVASARAFAAANRAIRRSNGRRAKAHKNKACPRVAPCLSTGGQQPIRGGSASGKTPHVGHLEDQRGPESPTQIHGRSWQTRIEEMPDCYVFDRSTLRLGCNLPYIAAPADSSLPRRKPWLFLAT